MTRQDQRGNQQPRAGAYELQQAEAAGIATQVKLDHKQFEGREDDAALAAAIDAYPVQLGVLAGFMRILKCRGLIRHYQGRLLGTAQRRAHRAGAGLGGREHDLQCCAEELDGRPLVVQVITGEAQTLGPACSWGRTPDLHRRPGATARTRRHPRQAKKLLPASSVYGPRF